MGQYLNVDLQREFALRTTEIGRSVNAAAVAELAWLAADGQPHATAVTPLLLDESPAVAFPYAQLATARQIAAASQLAMVLSDPRMTGGGWQPVAVSGAPHLTEDREGDMFAARLLEQELRKFPPARALADSLLLRRENWWYLPRLIVAIDGAAVSPVGERVGGAGGVLVVASGSQLYVDTVRPEPGGGDRLRLPSLAGHEPPDGPAVLFGHDFSVPDLEVWTPWTTRGQLGYGFLAVAERPERTGLGPVPGLWQRLRRHRQLERACRRGIEAD